MLEVAVRAADLGLLEQSRRASSARSSKLTPSGHTVCVSTRPPSILSTTLGRIRYRLALGVIGFGVYFGALLACAIPLCVYASYFDTGGALSEPLRWAISLSLLCIPMAVTYRFRAWIVQKAVTDVPPEPVRFWTGKQMGEAASELGGLVVGLAGLVIGLIVLAALAYGGYLILTVLTVPIAILVGAIIIALAVLALAAR